jgi:hypothetical protein
VRLNVVVDFELKMGQGFGIYFCGGEEGECGGLSVARQTMKPSVASVEMTTSFGFEGAGSEMTT